MYYLSRTQQDDMSDKINSAARERVLNVAEHLFGEKGYKGVTLRDIAKELGIRQASLYYHVPGGKEALYVAVMKQSMKRHREGLEQAIASTKSDITSQLQAAARWLLSQPPMNYTRMLQSDMSAISEENAEELRQISFLSLIIPLGTVFQTAVPNTPIGLAKARTLAGAFLSIVEGIHALPSHYSSQPKEQIADIIIDTLIHGI
jgi:AcrR family transcriptional regulator